MVIVQNNKYGEWKNQLYKYPTNRIIVADLFARGCFKGFDCGQFSLIKNPGIKDEIKEIF